MPVLDKILSEAVVRGNTLWETNKARTQVLFSLTPHSEEGAGPAMIFSSIIDDAQLRKNGW
jgi:hypothetical protein